MASDRVIGTELVNEDNLKGYYMADGAIYTYIRGDEYHNIFPFWDWRRIPGITTYESDAPIPTESGADSRNQTNLVGGTTDGKHGITAMHLNRNGLSANKVWIFTDEFILCLGSNIHTDSTATLITSGRMFYVNREDITFQHFWSIHSHKVMPLSFLLFCLYRTKFVLQEDISGVIMKIPAVSFRPYFSFLKTFARSPCQLSVPTSSGLYSGEDSHIRYFEDTDLAK